MSYLITVLVFLLIFSFLILIHELGHFVMAKRAGIKVEEFGMGLPPRLWGKKKGETIYSINWIPFGGFVRMYGDSGSDEKMLRSTKSFVGKPMRARVKVIVAGVVMNFFVAWALMVVGFTVGMQPLLVPDEIFDAVNDETIVLEPGLKVMEVEKGSVADQIGFLDGDVIYAFDDQKLNEFYLADIQKNPVGKFTLLGEDGVFRDVVIEKDFHDSLESDYLGLQFYDFLSFPRVAVFDLSETSKFYEAGLRSGDVFLTINENQIFSVDDYENAVRKESELRYQVFRDGFVEEILVENNYSGQVVVTEVLPSSPALEIGLLPKDVILSVEDVMITEVLQLISFLSENKEEVLSFLVKRGEENLIFDIKLDQQGRIGVLLSELISYENEDELSLYNATLISSIVEIKDEQYPFHVSLYRAFGETYKLSRLTVVMFGNFVSNLVQNGEVPATVAGPVGIAQMTHGFVQEGFVSILRFVAILSLSLAVINILPFPALDGGRLVFVLVELLAGRRVPQKWESYIHAFGYIFILMLIIAVTYSDILRIVSGS
jgi:regulator of sigma E protease